MKENKKEELEAIILNVGDEVLSGKIVNTNSSYLASELNKIGITTKEIIVVGDDKEALCSKIDYFLNSKTKILITTGGLGPTHDDFTKEVIAERLNLDLVLYPEALRIVKDYFNNEYAKCNEKQAYFPKNSLLIENKIGTADGAIIEYNDLIIIILVGPPFELKPMFENTVIPYLKKISNKTLLVKEYIIMGIGESSLEEKLEMIYERFPNIDISPYASLGKIRYQITANENELEDFLEVNRLFNNIASEYIISDNNESIEEKVVQVLNRLNYHISFCESCTGGLLASTIINVSGASSIINESLITYSNEAKIKYLNVSDKTISEFGVVSEEVVKEMALGLASLTKSEVCVSVSGIAGPTGGTVIKPVGLVWFCIKINEFIYTESKIFKGNREQVRTRAMMWILYKIYGLLNK